MREEQLSVLDRVATAVRAPEPSYDGFLRGRRRRQRHRRLAAGLALSVLVIAAGLFVDLSRRDGTHATRPIDTGPTPTTAPDTRSMLLPPEGLPPSRPETGEVVASIWFSHLNAAFGRERLSQVYVYADGRLIWLTDDDVPGGVAEEHLTADEVEAVRARFLATGVFDTDGAADGEVWAACACFLWVRDGNQLRSTEVPDPGAVRRYDDAVNDRVDQLVAEVMSLRPSLVSGSGTDQPAPQPYVPDRYRVCVVGAGEHAPTPVPDAPSVLHRRLPRELARLLAGVRTGVEPTSSAFACDRLTMDDTRTLVQGLVDEPGIELPVGSEGLTFAVSPRGPVREEVFLLLTPILPHGEAPGTYLG